MDEMSSGATRTAVDETVVARIILLQDRHGHGSPGDDPMQRRYRTLFANVFWVLLVLIAMTAEYFYLVSTTQQCQQPQQDRFCECLETTENRTSSGPMIDFAPTSSSNIARSSGFHSTIPTIKVKIGECTSSDEQSLEDKRASDPVEIMPIESPNDISDHHASSENQAGRALEEMEERLWQPVPSLDKMGIVCACLLTIGSFVVLAAQVVAIRKEHSQALSKRVTEELERKDQALRQEIHLKETKHSQALKHLTEELELKEQALRNVIHLKETEHQQATEELQNSMNTKVRAIQQTIAELQNSLQFKEREQQDAIAKLQSAMNIKEQALQQTIAEEIEELQNSMRALMTSHDIKCHPSYRDLAFQQPATQSSTYSNQHNASKAVDGNPATMTHTLNGDVVTWWQVELPDNSVVGEVGLWRRDGADCDEGWDLWCKQHYQDIFVALLDENHGRMAEHHLDGFLQRELVKTMDFGGKRARFVRIYMNRAEYLMWKHVKVLGITVSV